MFTRHFPHWPSGVPRSLRIPRTSVYYNLEVSATRYPESAVIDYYGSRISYSRMKREVDALAGFLQQRCGVAKGDRVLLYCQNGPHFMLGYYAILRADAVVVPVNPMNRTEELRHYVEDGEARTIVSTQELWDRIAPLIGTSALENALIGAHSEYLTTPTDLPLPDFVRAPAAIPSYGGVTSWREALAAGLAPGPHLAGPDDLAVMPYTSGTTGKPKGCMHTHSTVLSTSTAGCHWRGAASGSVALAVLPMFHVTGMQAGHEHADPGRRDVGGDDALGPRVRGDADRAREGDRLHRDHHHGGRFPRQPEPAEVRPLVDDHPGRRRRGDARSAGEEALRHARPGVHRGLRPDRDHGAEPHRTRRSAPSASARESRSSTPTRACSIPRPCASAGRTRWARS